MDLTEVEAHYKKEKEQIEQRMEDFRELKKASDKRWFQELVFVILSSQTNAKQAWEAAKKLKQLGELESYEEDIFSVLKKYEIQYDKKKAGQIVKAREELSQPDLRNPSRDLRIKDRLNFERPKESRKWLSDNLPGVGLKGASHFLRNIGYGENLGIASRHTLSALNRLDLIEDTSPPNNLDEYREIEKKMTKLAESLGITTGAVDLVLWSFEKGEVFR